MRLNIFLSSIISLLLVACNSSVKIRTGEEAFDAGQYSIAVKMLTEELDKTENRTMKAEKAFLMGKAYEMMNDPDNALVWFRRGVEGSDSPTRQVYLAYALKNTGRYAEAMQVFSELGKQLNDPNRFRSEMVSLNNAYQWQKDADTDPFRLTLSPFNSTDADYSPIIRNDGKIVFTSDRKLDETSDTYKWTGRGFSDIFVADSNAGEAFPLQGLVNTADNEGLLVYSQVGDEMAFCRCFDRVGGNSFCKILISKYVDGNWTDPQVLPFVNDSMNYLSPCFGRDSNLLFFAANDPQINSGFDIYYAQRHNGVWQDPVRLPSIINTEYDEKYITFDLDTMYFASNKPSGMGGLDIYKTYVARGSWMPPINLKAPVNSPYDDFSMFFDKDDSGDDWVLARGFITSNRPGGKGKDDIYRFTKIRLKESKPVIDTPVIDDKSILVKLNVFVRGHNVADGKLASGTTELPSASVTIKSGGMDTTVLADKYGKSSILIKVIDRMVFTASKEGYLTSSKTIDRSVIRIDSTKRIQEFNMVMNLYPVLYDQEIVIKDIFYDLDKYDIRKDAIGSLDELLSILRLNPSFKIRINSHTDCRGSDAYNMTLSAKRAKSVVDYLTANGINRNRLSSRGFGETMPLAKCLCEKCTEEEHQLNRRTTFQLVK